MIYKIMPAAEWAHAKAAGMYEGSEHDRRDGFIHFSTAAQAAETAAKYFAGQSGLVLLAVDPAPLGEALKWEPSRGGALFPHLRKPGDRERVRCARSADRTRWSASVSCALLSLIPAVITGSSERGDRLVGTNAEQCRPRELAALRVSIAPHCADRADDPRARDARRFIAR